jgi:tetratricopeptide (TPR) repeat protein
VRDDEVVEKVLQAVAPGAQVDRDLLGGLMGSQLCPEVILPLLADPLVERVRAAVILLGACGSMRDCPLLALCLQHPDQTVVKLAEYCLWCIWMHAGSEKGNRELAGAIDCIRVSAYDNAIDLLQELVAAEPAFAEAHFQLGVALCSVERHQEAARAYRQTLRLNPYHFGAAAALGHTCVQLGNLPGALHHYRQALRIHPSLEDVPKALEQVESIVQQRAN